MDPSSGTVSGPGAIVVLGAVALLLVAAAQQGRKRRWALAHAVADRGGKLVKVDADHFRATIRGFAVKLELAAAGKNSPRRTSIDVETPPFELVLALTKKGDKARKRGAASVDVAVENRALGEAWILEGAPASRIGRLLSDASLADRLVACAAQRRVEITAEDGKLHFQRDGHDYEDGVVLDENLDLMLDLAEAIVRESALPAPNAVVEAVDYRSAPRPREDRERERAEIAALKAQRAASQVKTARRDLLAMPAVATAFFTAFLFYETSGMKTVPALLRWLPLASSLAVALWMRSAWRSYAKNRRIAGLGFDRLAAAVAAVIFALGLAGGLGLFGY